MDNSGVTGFYPQFGFDILRRLLYRHGKRQEFIAWLA
jgi:hypothetical protein